jgi:hypothetical protein
MRDAVGADVLAVPRLEARDQRFEVRVGEQAAMAAGLYFVVTQRS